jgi:GAF domain-containing protein
VGESLSGRVVAAGEPIVVEDLLADTRYDPASKGAALAQGFHGFLGVPLRIHSQVIGTLNVYTKGHRRFTADEVSLLSALADQAALAIHKARLLGEAEASRHLVDDEIRQMIMGAPDGAAIRTAAIAAGMKTMFQDGLAKVLLGETTLEEVFRVAL